MVRSTSNGDSREVTEHRYPSPEGEMDLDTLVHLVLPVGRVPLSQHLRAQTAFLDLLREVSRTVAATRDDPVQWVVAEVRPSSADYALVPVPVPRIRVTPETIHRMSEAIPAGLAALTERGERPQYFTDRALEHTRTLSALLTKDFPVVRISNGHARAEISREVATHVSRVLEQPYVIDMGTVEGRLEAVNVHDRDRRIFVIFDELTAQRIECRFGFRIPMDTIRQGIERRVAVTGEIRSRESGEIISVIANEIEVFPDPDDLPTADDVLGILAR